MIENLRQLDKFLETCAKYGVTEVNWGGVVAKLGPMPLTPEQIKEVNAPELTEEQLAFMAVDGI